MPRQPFLPAYKRITTYEVEPRVLERRPELAAIIGQCIGLWGEVELHMGLCLGALLGVQSDAAVAVFLSLRNARAQREALSAAAGVSLTEADQEVFEAVLAVHGSVGKHRHDLAHGIYGLSDELPEKVLWLETARYANYLIQLYNKEAKPSSLKAHPHDALKKVMFVYSKEDLQEAYSLIGQAWEAAFSLHCYLRKNERSPAQRLEQLCSLPLAATELDRIRAGKRSKTEVRANSGNESLRRNLDGRGSGLSRLSCHGGPAH